MLQDLKAWLFRPRMIGSLILAVIIVAGSHFLSTLNLTQKLERLPALTTYVQQSLSSVDTIKIVNAFYYEFIGCEIVGEFPGYSIDCRGRGLAGPNLTYEERLGRGPEPKLSERFVTAVFNAVARLWNESTWLGLVIAVPAFWMAGVFMYNRLDGESPIVDFLYWTFATPVIASGVALALKILLLALVWIFSAALAGILWILATFGGLAFWLGRAWQVIETAEDIANARTDSSRDKPSDPSSGSG